MGFWNSIIGWSMIRFVDTLDEADVMIYNTGHSRCRPSPAGAMCVLAAVGHMKDPASGRMYSAMGVYTSHYKTPDRLRDTTILHEFGHVLGLDHDNDDLDSLMYPRMSNVIRQRLSVIDGKVIRTLYGGRVVLTH